MTVSALILLMALQTPYAPASDVYAPPTVRPFEPPASFADGYPAVGPVSRERPLITPVSLDRFRRSYEGAPEALDAAYEQGVAAAEAQADAMAGPLDGGWTVADASGRVLGRLVLADAGGAAIEGAWNAAGGGDRLSPLSLVREGEEAAASLNGRTLRLRRSGAGWGGTLAGAAVTLRRGL